MAGFVSGERSVGGGGSSQQGRWIRAARTTGVGRGQRPAAGAVGGGGGARWEAVVSNPNFSLSFDGVLGIGGLEHTVSFFSGSVPFRWSSGGAMAVSVIATNEMGEVVYMFGI
jgi:hypothetical protein